MRRFLSVSLVVMALASAAFAAPVASREPLNIKSNTLHADSDKKSATFEGKVVARQGDLTLYSDRLVISYSADGKDLSRAEAFGNVRILQGKREATGAHAVYDPKQARIVLDGSPRVVQGGDVLTGKLITYYVNEQRSEVTGGVQAVIIPGGKDVGSKP